MLYSFPTSVTLMSEFCQARLAVRRGAIHKKFNKDTSLVSTEGCYSRRSYFNGSLNRQVRLIKHTECFVCVSVIDLPRKAMQEVFVVIQLMPSSEIQSFKSIPEHCSETSSSKYPI